MIMRDFISLNNFTLNEINKIIYLADIIKKKPQEFTDDLRGKHIGLLFEKPSLRTKTAFYLGALELGADSVYYTPEEVNLGVREEICDVARTVSGYMDAVVLRTFSHKTILEFSKYSSIPVVNALSDLFHPSQIIADILTIQEFKGELNNLKVSYIGDANNVCNSLIYVFSILGGNLNIASPEGYTPTEHILEESKKICTHSGGKINILNSCIEVAHDADVLYTDAWTSMGCENEEEKRKNIFKDFQINDNILTYAKKDCIVMHCLPAHRGEEITDSVIDGKHSVVFMQAKNRLYAAKAILRYILKD